MGHVPSALSFTGLRCCLRSRGGVGFPATEPSPKCALGRVFAAVSLRLFAYFKLELTTVLEPSEPLSVALVSQKQNTLCHHGRRYETQSRLKSHRPTPVSLQTPGVCRTCPTCRLRDYDVEAGRSASWPSGELGRPWVRAKGGGIGKRRAAVPAGRAKEGARSSREGPKRGGWGCFTFLFWVVWVLPLSPSPPQPPRRLFVLQLDTCHTENLR